MNAMATQKGGRYISLSSARGASSCPFTVPSRVFMHQPLTPRVLAVCSVYWSKKLDLVDLNKLNKSAGTYLAKEDTWNGQI